MPTQVRTGSVASSARVCKRVIGWFPGNGQPPIQENYQLSAIRNRSGTNVPLIQQLLWGFSYLHTDR